MIVKKRTNYLSNENLIKEIQESQKIQTKYPDRTPAECLTPNLTRMIMLLVDRYGSRFNWRSYSYNEDMRAEAVASLCQSALKFDPEKSQNPFGYYTQIAHRCFLTYLDKEKKLRRIRDDLIEMYADDLNPSSTRQFENDLTQLDDDLDGTKAIPSIKPGPGRKKKVQSG